MRGIEDLMRALDERPLTLSELFQLVNEYKKTLTPETTDQGLTAPGS
jgi:hypothetical protein